MTVRKNKPLAFGLIGCGRIAPRHVQSLMEIDGARLAAVCDVIESRAQKFSDETGAEVYTDYRELLDRRDIDVISVCVPSGLHADIGVQAAQAGKHVLVEKPVALSLEDTDRLVQAAADNGVTLAVVLQNRFNPPVQELRRLVDSGRMGKLLLGNATVRWYRPQRYYEDTWHGTWAMDGGVLLNQAIHHVDALQWMMGEVHSVTAYMDTLAHQIETPDVCVANLRFTNGALGVIEASVCSYPKNLEGSITLFGEKASVKIGGTALNRKEIWKIEGMLEQEADILANESIDPPSVYGWSHKAQYLEMIAAIRQGRAPATDGQQARQSLRLVLAIHAAAQSGKEVLLAGTNGVGVPEGLHGELYR